MHGQPDFISSIVLAAGRSTRMGIVNKLRLEIDGKPMLSVTIEALLHSSIDEIVVVLGHEENRFRQVLPGGIRMVLNANYRKGMATSIKCGVQNLSPESSAVYIVLADMPFISPKTIRAMTRNFQNARRPTIVVPFYQGRQGHPVLFDRHFFPDLLALEGDCGAKSIINKYRKNIVRFDCDDPAILQDIDTPEAFGQFKRCSLKPC